MIQAMLLAEIQQGLQYVFQTSSKYTLLVSGSGHAGMEAAIANVIEPGETIIVGDKVPPSGACKNMHLVITQAPIHILIVMKRTALMQS